VLFNNRVLLSKLGVHILPAAIGINDQQAWQNWALRLFCALQVEQNLNVSCMRESFLGQQMKWLSEFDAALPADFVMLFDQQADPGQYDSEATKEKQNKDDPSGG
jgi:hypothetical protein